MAIKKNIIPVLNDMDKAELDRIKTILDIQNLKDQGVSKFEIFIKKRIVPVFLPFITLLVTIFFFWINLREAEKSKALDRYKSEVDMVKMVWADMKEMDTVSPKFKTSKKFLIEMFNANYQFYKSDSAYLGIGKNQRPIMVLTNINVGMQKAIAKIEKNDEIAEALQNAENPESPSTSTVNGKQSILVSKSAETIKAVNDVAGNALKVYIQYTMNVGGVKAKYLASQLKPYYIVPPIQNVGDNEDDNEIRYYTEADRDKAVSLATKIKDITGLEFRLKTINNNKIKNTIEVWYCDASMPAKTVSSDQITTPSEISKNSGVTQRFQRFTAPGYQSKITDDITIYVDQYQSNTETALIRINDAPAEEFKKNVPRILVLENWKVTINVTDFKRATVRKAVYYDLSVEKPK